MDARIRYTKMRIRESVIQLLRQKSARAISVKEVCELAEINRATFYKHYMDIFDLLEKLEEEQLAAIFAGESDTEREEANNFNEKSVGENESEAENEQSAGEDALSVLTYYLTRVSLAEGMVSILGGKNGDPLFYRRIAEKLNTKTQIDHLVLTDDETAKEKNLIEKMCCAATTEIIADWVQNGMQTSPEFVANDVQRLVGAFKAEYTPEEVSAVYRDEDSQQHTEAVLQDEIKGSTGLFGWFRKTLLVE